MEPDNLSQELLEKVRNDESVDEKLEALAEIDLKALHDKLEDQNSRKAFFLNYYNAEAQRLAREHPILHRLKVVYIIPFLKLAGERISLNTVENGVLRSSKRKIRLRNTRFVRIMHLEKADARIHFALNCASHSCPPIRFYEAEEVDKQLELATENYLTQEVEIDNDKVYLPRVFKWYSYDFDDMEEFVRTYVELPENPEFSFKSFDWSLKTNNFVEE